MKTEILKAENRNLDYQKVEENIVGQLGSYMQEAGVENSVIGVSGGIDSAVCSAIAAQSSKTLRVLQMPIHQNNDEVSRAEEHIAWLEQKYKNVVSEIVDLTDVYDSLQKLQSEGVNPEAEYLAGVNLRSRLRAAQLYSSANRNNALVIGTGNLVEDYGIGFFTKFGDGAVDVSPIGELYKSEVRQLASQMGISRSIIDARPTDGLHPSGATDEDQIGASYDELEWALQQYDMGRKYTDFTGRARDIMYIYSSRHEGNAHKMQMPPVLKKTA